MMLCSIQTKETEKHGLWDSGNVKLSVSAWEWLVGRKAAAVSACNEVGVLPVVYLLSKYFIQGQVGLFPGALLI